MIDGAGGSRRRHPVAAFWAVAWALIASSGSAGSDTVIWQGDDQSVFLTPQDAAAAAPNEHPVDLTATEIETLLAALTCKPAEGEADSSAVPVFNRAQLEILGRALSAGLAQADPSQDVAFSVIGAHRLAPGAFAQRNRLTAGRAFVREGRLNVIFGEIHSPYRKKNVYGRLDEDFSPRRYGSRGLPAAQPSVVLAVAGRDGRPDWVELDPGAAPVPPSGESAAGGLAAGSSGAASPDPPDDAASIERRLQTLKRLREKGLISEEAYRNKVDEILSEL